jgi:uncharacterized membrane protein (UPF0182 family)
MGADDPDRDEGPPVVPPGIRRRSPLAVTVAVLGALALVVTLLAQFWTEILWFDSVHMRTVFTTQLGTEVLLGFVGGALTAGLAWSSLWLGHRARPVYPPTTPQQDALDRYREALEPVRRVGTIVIPILLGLITGAAAAAQWEPFLLWRNATSFGTTDPQFGLDIGFFVFSLPWLQFVVGFLTMVVVIGTVAAAFSHYVYGGLSLTNRGRDTTRAALLHLSCLLAVLVLLRAASYWLERFSLSLQTSDLMTGIQYTDANAVLPTKAILAVASVMCAAMFLSVIWTRSWRLPVIGTVLLLVTSIVVGGIFPALIQSLKVKPSEKSLEAPYLQHNIDATRAAYGLDGIQKTAYQASTTLTQDQLRATAATIPGIRVIDPNVVPQTFKQDHAARSFYAVADTLDVDRYTVKGAVSDTIVAAREMDLEGVPAGARNWLNDHTVYTHGYGLIAAYGNQVASDGHPVYLEDSIPAGTALGTYEPRIYFGEQSDTYAIAGAPDGATPREFDYLAESESAAQVNNTYTGSGGVALDGAMRRLAYAVKYRELNFLLSDQVNQDSRLLDYRTPRERVQKVAPWLTLDGNPYPSIVDGRVLWIIDGYTTTASYPNAALTSMQTSTTDSVTKSKRSVTALDQGQVNYIRNSVKATVDAFDGSVHLYAWDQTDPILAAWMAAFPGTVEPLQDISPSLMSHLRYPEDLFKVQRQVLARYHVETADSFYGKQDFWRVPVDPTQDQKVYDQPAYYLSLPLPGQPGPEFSLTTSFMPVGDRGVLTGFLAVDSNAGNARGAKRDGYGALRLLEIPSGENVSGPPQVQNDILSSNQGSSNQTSGAQALTLSQFINQSRQSGTVITLGNLLTLPMAGGVLYVEPIYIQGSSGTSSFPIVREIVVVFGNKLAWSNTLEGALNGLFGGQAATAPTAPTAPTTPSTPGVADPVALAQAIADAQKAYTDGEAALKAGDFAAYGEAQKRLKDALSRAAAAAPTGSLTLSTSAPTTTG